MCATRPTSPPPVASEWTVSAPSEAPCWIFASTASPRAKKKVDARKGSTSESMSSHTPSLSTGGTVEASSPEDSRSSTSREARCCSEVLAQTPRPLSSATRINDAFTSSIVEAGAITCMQTRGVRSRRPLTVATRSRRRQWPAMASFQRWSTSRGPARDRHSTRGGARKISRNFAHTANYRLALPQPLALSRCSISFRANRRQAAERANL